MAIADLDFNETTRAPRGALDQAFRSGLFSVAYGRGYYSGYTDREDLLGVEDPEWEVQVWERVDGEMVEVTRVQGGDQEGEGKKVVVIEGPKRPEDLDEDEDEDEDHDEEWDWREMWGAVSVGTEFTPFRPEGEIDLFPSRVIANQFAGFGQQPGLRALRGVDLRWWAFSADGAREYPLAEGYFRSGYTQGVADFLPEDEAVGFEPGDPTRLRYLTVPLFVGGNIYPFRRFPLRPFAGAGFGFDILQVRYDRLDRVDRTDVSARIGFELHAGLDLRITNYFSLVGEVRQLWSARRKLDHLPDYSNEGLTIVTSLKFGFPLHRGPKARQQRKERQQRKKQQQEAAPVPPPAPSSSKDGASTPPSPKQPEQEKTSTPADAGVEAAEKTPGSGEERAPDAGEKAEGGASASDESGVKISDSASWITRSIKRWISSSVV